MYSPDSIKMLSVNYFSQAKDMDMWVEAVDQIPDTMFHWGGENSINQQKFKYLRSKGVARTRKILLSEEK